MNLIVIQNKIINLNNIVSIEQSKDRFYIYFIDVSYEVIKFKFESPESCDDLYVQLLSMAKTFHKGIL